MALVASIEVGAGLAKDVHGGAVLIGFPVQALGGLFCICMSRSHIGRKAKGSKLGFGAQGGGNASKHFDGGSTPHLCKIGWGFAEDAIEQFLAAGELILEDGGIGRGFQESGGSLGEDKSIPAHAQFDGALEVQAFGVGFAPFAVGGFGGGQEGGAARGQKGAGFGECGLEVGIRAEEGGVFGRGDIMTAFEQAFLVFVGVHNSGQCLKAGAARKGFLCLLGVFLAGRRRCVLYVVRFGRQVSHSLLAQGWAMGSDKLSGIIVCEERLNHRGARRLKQQP